MSSLVIIDRRLEFFLILFGLHIELIPKGWDLLLLFVSRWRRFEITVFAGNVNVLLSLIKLLLHISRGSCNCLEERIAGIALGSLGLMHSILPGLGHGLERASFSPPLLKKLQLRKDNFRAKVLGDCDFVLVELVTTEHVERHISSETRVLGLHTSHDFLHWLAAVEALVILADD